MNILFSIRYLRADNDTHHAQLKKTIRKTKTNWNYPPWMNSVTADSLDDILAAYDWFLFLKETEDQPLRFGTVTTQWKDMGGFRDFCFIPELFPGEPSRLVKWINKTTAKALRVTEQEGGQLPDNAALRIQTYNSDTNRIAEWIKSRLTTSTKPRQSSIIEYLMVSHKDWIDIGSKEKTSANQSTSN